MEIYEILKIMSSKNKARIIAKIFSCNNLKNNTVNEMCDELNLKQCNMSKHLMELREKNIIIDNKVGRNVHYTINKDFKDKWGSFITQIINQNEDLKQNWYKCEK